MINFRRSTDLTVFTIYNFSRTKGVSVVRMYGSPAIKSSSDEENYHLNTARGYDYKLTLARFLDDVFIIEKGPLYRNALFAIEFTALRAFNSEHFLIVTKDLLKLPHSVADEKE